MPINAENAPKITSLGRLDMKCVKDMGRIFIASDGQSLLSGSALWNIPTGALLIQATNLPHNIDGSIQTQIPSQLLVLSPDGKTLAIRSGNQVELWDVITGKIRRNLTGHKGLVTSLAFSADSKLLASGSGSDEQMIRLWKVDDGSLAGSLPGYTALNLAYTPDGEHLIIEGGNAVRIWRFSENRVLDPLQGVEGNVVLSPDGMFLAFASCNERVSRTCISKLVSLYRLSEGTVAYSLTPMTGQIQTIQFSNDGSMVAAASRNGINIWRVMDGTTIQNMHIPNSAINVRELLFSPDGKLIVSSSEDNTLRVWQIADGKMLYERSIGNINSIAFSPDGTFIAVLADMLELFGVPQ
jgi:WD40 repeat protein